MAECKARECLEGLTDRVSDAGPWSKQYARRVLAGLPVSCTYSAGYAACKADAAEKMEHLAWFIGDEKREARCSTVYTDDALTAIRSLSAPSKARTDPTMPPGVVPGPTGAASSCRAETDEGEVERLADVASAARWEAYGLSRNADTPWEQKQVDRHVIRAVLAARKGG